MEEVLALGNAVAASAAPDHDAWVAEAPVAAVRLDDTLRITAASAAAARMLGEAGPGALVGRTAGQVLPSAALAGAAQRVLERGVPETAGPDPETGWGGSAVPAGCGVMVLLHQGPPPVRQPLPGRRREDRAARRDREMLDRLVGRLPVLIAIADPGLPRRVSVNAEFSRVLGWTDEDVARLDLVNLCCPEPEHRERARAFLQALEPGWEDFCLVARDGRRVETSWASLRLGDGTLVGIGIDLTERRRASQALRESEQRMRGLFDAAAVGIVEVDGQDRFVAANDRFCRMLGYERGEILGRSLHELTDPRDRFRSRELNGRLHGGGLDFFEYEKRYLRKDGTPLWAHVAVSAVRDAQGRLIQTVATIEDISPRKTAEEERVRRERSESRLRRLYDSGIIGVLHFSLDGPILQANDRFLEMVGYDRVDLVAGGLDWATLTPPEYAGADRRAVEELRASGVDTPYEKEFLRKDGTRVAVLAGAAMLDDETHEGIAFVVDTTERRRAEARLLEANARLREADRRKDEFLGMLSHELRNPLAPIRNALFILERAMPGSPQATRARTMAVRQVAYLTRLVDDLLDVTRIARGKIELRRAELDLGGLVRRTGEDHRATLQERGLTLVLDLPDGPVPVSGDETRLAQVLGNLLHNAGKFTPAGGQVTVAVRRGAGEVVLEVTDTGHGLQPDAAAHIFEPFVQAEQGLARTEGGLGLGLALVRGITELHGGAVEARSPGPGKGATFAVTLPLA